jgi:hypothetical protein
VRTLKGWENIFNQQWRQNHFEIGIMLQKRLTELGCKANVNHLFHEALSKVGLSAENATDEEKREIWKKVALPVILQASFNEVSL